MKGRAILLRVCAAAWGLAIGISLYPLWLGPARPGQPAGLLTALNLDARGPLRFAGALTLLTLLLPVVLAPLLDRLAGGRRWAANVAALAMLASLWFVSMSRDVRWAAGIPLAALAVCFPLRHRDAGFSRRDVILLPVFATVFLALVDGMPAGVNVQVIVAAAIVLAIRLALDFIRPAAGLAPALCFAAAPLGIALQSQFNGFEQRHSPWLPLLLAIVTPFALRLTLRDTPRTRARLRAAIALAVYPIAAYGYSSATSIVAADGMPRADFFEDQHHVVPAAEMLRGEKPYRDIIPPHGLLQDALLDYAALRTGPPTLGRALRTRDVITRLGAPLTYALGAAVTGSPEAGILAFFAATLLGTTITIFRPIPAILALVFLALAMLRRSARWFAWAGGAAVLAAMTSLDFGAYAILTIIIAALRFRPRRTTFRHAAAGAACAAIPLLIALVAGGILVDFVRVTLTEVVTLGPAYALPPILLPTALINTPFIPEAAVALFDKNALAYVMWVLIVVGLAAALSLPGRRSRAAEAMIIVAIFATLTTFSYVERHHTYWPPVAAALIVAGIFRLFRSRDVRLRALAPVAAILTLVVAQPTIHVAIVGGLRHAHGPSDPTVRELGLPRARGALFAARDAQIIDVVHRYTDAHLRPGETFFDFTNRGLLYFVLDRDCPIRQLEVAFYQPPALQREVIARIEHNPRVRFALIPHPSDPAAFVDTVPNQIRAPLVWRYLEEHFTPDHEEAGIWIWRRK
jgi:hypothetical protein